MSLITPQAFLQSFKAQGKKVLGLNLSGNSLAWHLGNLLTLLLDYQI